MRKGGGSGTWVRQPKPGSLGQNIPTGVRPGQVAIGGGVRREDVSHCQHVAEQPAQGEPQQHLPITCSSGVQSGYDHISSTVVGEKVSPCSTLSPAHGMEAEGQQGILVAFPPSLPPHGQGHGHLLPLCPLATQAGLGSTDSGRHEWKEPRQPGAGEASPSAIITASLGTPTYREDLEEVDWGEVALPVSLVRRQRHRHIFQVLREQNYERNSPRRREYQTMRQSGYPTARLSPY